MLRSLLRKDCRIQAVALVAVVCVVVAPYGYAAVEYFRVKAAGVGMGTPWQTSLEQAGRISLIASLFVVAMLAGAAFAVERSDRSHEFLTVLPPTRLMILSSKALVVAVATGALWALNPYTIMKIAPMITGGAALPAVSEDAMLATVSAMGVSVLGSGWFGSILVTNPASSLLIGLLSPFFCSLFAYGICGSAHNGEDFRIAFVYGCLAVGVGALVVGTLCFLHREQA